MTAFWSLALPMALALAAAIAWPLVRSRADGTPAEGAAEIEIFRSQLRDVERDLERGVLTESEARSLRLEIQRRLLAADARASAKPRAAGRLPSGWPAAAAVGIVVVAGSFASYFALGAPGLADQPLAQRPDVPPAHQVQDLTRMAEALRTRLEQNPNQLEGWILLGRTYRSLDRFQESAEAFRRAVEVSGRTAETLSALGGALVLANNGIISEEAFGVFKETVAKDPFEGRARFYLGMAAVQAGDFRTAMQTWTDLIALSPPDAAWLPQVRAQLAELGAKIGIDPAIVKPSPDLPKR